VTGCEDVLLHLRVPLSRLVSEMNARLEKLLHGDNCHNFLRFTSPLRVPPPLSAGKKEFTDTESGAYAGAYLQPFDFTINTCKSASIFDLLSDNFSLLLWKRYAQK